MNFKPEEYDIENNNNINNSTPKYPPTQVVPPSYDSDREPSEKDNAEQHDEQRQRHQQDHAERNRESSVTPSERDQCPTYPSNPKKLRTSVCDNLNSTFGTPPERHSDPGLVRNLIFFLVYFSKSVNQLLLQPLSLSIKNLSPVSKMEVTELDEVRRISPLSNPSRDSRDQMSIKPEMGLPNMPGLHRDMPQQLLPVRLLIYLF